MLEEVQIENERMVDDFTTWHKKSGELWNASAYVDRIIITVMSVSIISYYDTSSYVCKYSQ